jgi:GGDEF domain-containing protein
VISFRKVLSDRDTSASLLRMVHLLLKGMGEQAVKGEPDDYTRFRQTVDAVSAALAGPVDADEYLLQTGVVLKALEDYNSRTSRVIRQAGAEYVAMMRMLTSTAAAIGASSKENIDRLLEIEKRVATATQIDDVRSIKAALSECLKQISQETTRQRASSEHTLEQLNRGLQAVRKTPALMHGDNDGVTGLPPRALAEAGLAQASRSDTPIYVAVMVLDRLQSFNATFGRETGDQVLCYFARFVRRQLLPNDQAFRWSGPALVALLSRTEGIESVREEFGRLMEQQLEYTVRSANRTILLPVAPRWIVLPMMAAPRLLFQKIDAFAALPGSDGR